jgi:4-hydroxy-tetrahydrodipicolinate synthase
LKPFDFAIPDKEKEVEMFKGSIVAIVTPFKDGKIDEEGYRELIEFQISNGTSAIVPCGTTGESATLSMEEHCHVIDIALDAVNKRVPVIAGTGGNSTAEAIVLTEHAKNGGADATLQVTPYYNKPTQEGLYHHFKAIADAAPLPQVLYNVPGRTSLNMLPETVARLAELPDIVAVKEASGNLGQMAEILRLAGDKITLLSGDDNLTLPVLAIGGKGVISVIANIVPKDSADMVQAWENGDVGTARELFYKLFPLSQAMFFETNPIPVKTSLSLMGMIGGEMRLPLFPMASSNLEKLKKVLKDYGLI